MDILDEAGLAERFMPKPKIPKAASMFDILEFTYDPKDHGYYNSKKLKLRANNKHTLQHMNVKDKKRAPARNIAGWST